MKIQKQLFRHDPEGGVWGDCHRTAIACILDMDAADVPHFMDEDNPDAFRDAEIWLGERGMAPINIIFPGETSLSDVLYTIATLNPGTAFILGGTSRAGSGHSVVCKDGEIVCDPSLDDNGIIGPMRDGNYWITFIGHKQAVFREAA